MGTTLRLTILIILILLTAFSWYSTISTMQGSSICLPGDITTAHVNCSLVQNSKYAQILGVKVDLLGSIAISLLLIIYILSTTKNRHKKLFQKLYIVGTILGFAGAVYFISIQAFILKKFCPTCMLIDSTIILISALSWLNRKNGE